jgi:hypothetical protein
MSRFEMLWFGVWGTLFVIYLVYWGNLAWFHSEKLKEKLMKHAQQNPDWLFFKGYSLRFSERYGISMIRLITLVGALMISAVAILIALQLLESIK